ncbi:MAG: hypothetical protein M5R36_29080 [Deltaproteobacteria bacterium]|nr:hypothetical protein [Deltaproteobacteria bacterium]
MDVTMVPRLSSHLSVPVATANKAAAGSSMKTARFAREGPMPLPVAVSRLMM